MNRPKHTTQTYDEMVASETERKLDSRIFSKTAESSLVIKAITENLARELVSEPEKIDLHDTDRVRDVLIAYTIACSQVGILPTKSGACHALGLTMRAVNYYLQRHSEEDTAKLLYRYFESYADALALAGLSGVTDRILTIFCLKNNHNWTDTHQIETLPHDPTDEYQQTPQDIVDKYKDLFPD